MEIRPVLEDPIWERQPGETAVAYAAFRAYRDLGEGRTLDKAVAVLLDRWPDIAQRDSRSRLSQTSYKGRAGHWSSKNQWVERATAWDAHVESIRLRAEEKGMKNMARHVEARVEQVREIEYEIGNAAYKALVQALQVSPLGETRETKDGKTIIHVAPNPVFFKNLPGIMREGSRMIRLSLGMPTEGARMPTPPLDTSADSDVQTFLENLSSDEVPPSVGLADATEPS